ncbi:MAG: hypothetical protein QF570_17660 [Myxococcota bacterium]|jgi:hypothetical protein|nr:hypothetical protein [Myxococcota bacterium]
MEVLAPALLALLFIVFGLFYRQAAGGGCGNCACTGECKEKEERGEVAKQ